MCLTQDKLSSALNIAFKKMQKSFYILAQEHKIATCQWSALKTLYNHDGLTISQLSEKLFTKNSSMTTLVDRLERDGYVKRERKASDRRVIRIFLTDKGIATNKSLPDFEKYFTGIAGKKLTPEEINTLKKLLNKLSESID
ncbi:transcriptional regulator [Desulfocucumis palustris]|uniref:Transcriptional regulator n=1 Tax=Desulfocucumis palustris TaxID=1898651 RepID=A0A2L2XAB8_9FIRM|nr:MarR family transcriptional regulator [Desulfocucumis palustris]GBF32904.1 transcriptional regulator [Desulfocucumis palustris]